MIRDRSRREPETVRAANAQRRQLAASVFEHAHDGIVITDRAGRILQVNDAFMRITGYAADELVGNNPRLLQSGRHAPEFYAALWAAVTREGVWRGEIWNRRKNGEIYAELLTLSAICSANGRVRNYVGVYSDMTGRKESQRRLERMAHYDTLTQLPNRVLFADRLRIALAQARRTGKLLAVCYLDLDDFKPINDIYGHPAGDRLLAEVAGRLADAVRGGDTVARLGGDEFALLLGELDDANECRPALERVFSTLGRPFGIESETVSISASIGVTLFPLDDSDPETLLRHADQAMYVAKRKGRNHFQVFDATQKKSSTPLPA
ncbi:diguanylate cyclase domain-containing protein [Sulfuritalea sp.]|uniref:diguanylate cyclase domain-containing protein n=1 Tax=Sulfuritalea sp. TaxID=2480090 RepID=UPI00286D96E1|nr:diguanylate cyclase [Sulfuritalea sp.]